MINVNAKTIADGFGVSELRFNEIYGVVNQKFEKYDNVLKIINELSKEFSDNEFVLAVYILGVIAGKSNAYLELFSIAQQLISVQEGNGYGA